MIARNPNSRMIPGAGRIHSIRNQKYLVRGLLLLLAIIGFWFLGRELREHLSSRGVNLGFSFLGKPTTVPIAESVMPYDQDSDNYLAAFAAGASNTIVLTIVVAALATALAAILTGAQILGTSFLTKSCEAVVEFIRNVPAVLQLLFWYSLLKSFPSPGNSIWFGESINVSNRGMRFAWPEFALVMSWHTLLICVSVVFIWLSLAIVVRKSQRSFALLIGLGLCAIVLVLSLILKIDWNFPRRVGLGFGGGANLSIETLALTVSLSIYACAYISEVMRAGVMAIAVGQKNAALAFGMTNLQAYRYIIIPQAIKVMMPPLITEYLNILKNTSLALIIGFQDVGSITNTIINNTGQAIEPILIMILFYFGAGCALNATSMMLWLRLGAARSNTYFK